MNQPEATPAREVAAEARALAASLSGLLAAWSALAQAEFALARRSLRALAIGALVAPALLLGAWFSVIALLVVALHAIGLGWLSASAASCALQVLSIGFLVRAMRRWTRDLSLQHTRAVLVRLLEPPT